MTSTINKKNDFTLEITVELDKEDLSQYIKEAEKKLSKEIKLDGFRDGKIPPDVIRKKLGEDIIRQEALDIAIRRSIFDVITKENLEVIEQKDLKIKENTKEKLVYTILVTSIPSFEVSGYEDIKIENKKIEVTKEEEEKTISDILASRASLRQVDREVQKGDRIEINYELKENGKLMPHGKSEKHPLIIGETNLMPGFEENLIGMKKGEEKTFSIDVPKDYYNKDFSGKKIEATVNVTMIQERTIPELTDEFASSIGNFKSAEDLKKNIKEGITLEKEEREKNRARADIMSQLTEKNKIKFPEELVERQLEDMIESFGKELEEKGMEMSFYLAHIKKTQDDLKKEWRKQAEKQVAMQLISRKIVQQENIEVDPSIVEDEFNNVLQRYQSVAGTDAIKNIDIDGVKNRIHNTMIMDKVFEFLEKKVKTNSLEK